MIVNYDQRADGSLFLVFMLPGNGLFLKGEMKPELVARAGEITRFWWADIQFIDSEDEDAALEILKLVMDRAAETSPPAF